MAQIQLTLAKQTSRRYLEEVNVCTNNTILALINNGRSTTCIWPRNYATATFQFQNLVRNTLHQPLQHELPPPHSILASKWSLLLQKNNNNKIKKNWLPDLNYKQVEE